MIDKKLQSKSAITYNDGLIDTNSSVITGKVVTCSSANIGENHTISFVFTDNEGKDISRSAFKIEGSANYDDLFEQISPLLPAPVSKSQDMLTENYYRLLITATEIFNNNVSDWEVVNVSSEEL